MRTIDPKDIKEQLNNCYDAYDPNWEKNIGKVEAQINFKNYLEKLCGIRLDFKLETNYTGGHYYKINSMSVVDEQLFTLWLLKWA